MVLTSTSTGVNGARRNGQQMYSSIFQVDCLGRITATVAGQKYYMDTANGALTFIAGESTYTLSALPLTIINQPSRFRRNTASFGVAPRCGSDPAGLVSSLKANARAVNTNRCGTDNGLPEPQPARGKTPQQNPPTWGFGPCCAAQNACYDDCSKTFEECNQAYKSCMRNDCAGLNSWWDSTVRFSSNLKVPEADRDQDYRSCNNAADRYGAGVDATGRDVFYKANNARCECRCPGGGSKCNNPGSTSATCRNIFNEDKTNCGACGRTCEENSRW